MCKTGSIIEAITPTKILIDGARCNPSKILILQRPMESKHDVSAEVVFEYTGKGCSVPKNVTIVRFHPSVVYVDSESFRNCEQLREVVLNEKLQKFGEAAICADHYQASYFPLP